MNKYQQNCYKFSITFLFLLSASCSWVPEGVKPVSGFDVDRYLGKWYEIARLDHSFERGLTKVTAEYQMQNDGAIKVINRGYNEEEQKWNEAIGKAYFLQSPDIGQLKVSFFGPFYGGYNIIELDKINYQYSLVSGPNRKYLWILARTSKLEQSIINDLVNKAKALGFPTNDLIYLYDNNNF